MKTACKNIRKDKKPTNSSETKICQQKVVWCAPALGQLCNTARNLDLLVQLEVPIILNSALEVLFTSEYIIKAAQRLCTHAQLLRSFWVKPALKKKTIKLQRTFTCYALIKLIHLLEMLDFNIVVVQGQLAQHYLIRDPIMHSK